MDAVKIGTTLRQLREKKGKTLQEVQEDTGIDISLLSRYENGERIPSDPNKIKLAAYYKRSVKGIFFAE